MADYEVFYIQAEENVLRSYADHFPAKKYTLNNNHSCQPVFSYLIHPSELPDERKRIFPNSVSFFGMVLEGAGTLRRFGIGVPNVDTFWRIYTSLLIWRLSLRLPICKWWVNGKSAMTSISPIRLAVGHVLPAGRLPR